MGTKGTRVRQFVMLSQTDLQDTQGGHILAKMKFPVFSLCYRNFPCVIFMQKTIISSMNKGQITTVSLHTEAYKLFF